MVLPTVVCRFITKFGSDADRFPSAATFAVEVLFSLSGAVNAILFWVTRPDLLGLGAEKSRQHRLGIAPGIALGETKSIASDTESIRSRSGNEQNPEEDHAVGFLPEAGDGGWAPPSMEHGSRE